MHTPLNQPFKAVFDSDNRHTKARHGRFGDSSNNGIQSRTVSTTGQNAQPAQFYGFTIACSSHRATLGGANLYSPLGKEGVKELAGRASCCRQQISFQVHHFPLSVSRGQEEKSFGP